MAGYFEKPLREKVDLSNEQMFKEVFVGYFAPLCVFAQKYVGNFHDEDVVSAVFSNMYQKKMVFDSKDDFVFYLYRSVKNKCLDTLKSDNRMVNRNQVYSEELEHEDFFNDIVENEVLAETYREIQSLPEYSKRIIELSYFEGFSNQEIADELQLSLQTVKNYKRNAVASLRTALVRKAILSLLLFIGIYLFKMDF